MLTKVEAAAVRAANIARDLLNFSRRREPKQAPVAVAEVVERAIDLLRAKLKRAAVEVQTVFEPGTPSVLGDQDQLLQVFLNLLGNAIDAMPEGGPLTISTEVRDGHGTRHVVTRVADRGGGIPADKLGRIFEPFYTTKPEGQGTGLGLPISLGLVKRHGGTLQVESEPGKGTAMIVTLPAT
jgi:signal transduction histidine kinase